MAFPTPSEFHAKFDTAAKVYAEEKGAPPQSGIRAMAEIWMQETAEVPSMAHRRILAEETLKIAEKSAEERIKVTSQYYFLMGLAYSSQPDLQKWSELSQSLDQFVQVRPRTAPGRLESVKIDDKGKAKLVEETSEVSEYDFPVYDISSVPEWPSEWPQPLPVSHDEFDSDEPFDEEDRKLIDKIDAGEFYSGYEPGKPELYTEHSAVICDESTIERRMEEYDAARDWMMRWPPLHEEGDVHDEYDMEIDWETHRALMFRARSSSLQNQNQSEKELSDDQQAIIPFHEALLSAKSFVAADGNLQFPELPKEAIYNCANVFSARWTTSVKQSEAILDIKGSGIRPVFLPPKTQKKKSQNGRHKDIIMSTSGK